jgi:hypothetical protein
MKFIGKNENLFKKLCSEIYIISASINQFNIFVNAEGGLVIEIGLELLYNEQSHCKLTFSKIEEYSFSWNSKFNFYNIEQYKLLRKENLFYISFDPDEETGDEISDTDHDFILFADFEGYYL